MSAAARGRRAVLGALGVLLLLGAAAAAPSAAAGPGEAAAEQGAPAGTGAGFLRYIDRGFTAEATKDIVYGSAVDHAGTTVDLHLDLYEPAGDVLEQRPAMVFVHGGSFAIGDRSDMADFAIASAERGYVAVTIQYRLRPGPGSDIVEAMTDAGHDTQMAVRWLRANASTYRIDPDRIGVSGASAGAIASMFATFLPEQSDPAPGDVYSSDVAMGGSFAGFWFEGAAEPWSPPIFMAHGTNDTTVPLAWATPLCDATIADGNVCDLHTYPSGHESLANHLAEIETVFVPFVRDHLVVAGDRCGDAFEDVAGDHAFCGEIEWAAHRGLAGGWPDKTFRPTVTVSRQAASAWLHRAEGADPGPFADPAFPDVGATHPFLVPISWAVDGGLLEGYVDGTFRPTAPLSRQAAAALLFRDAGSPAGPFPDPSLADVAPDHPFFTEISWMIDAGLSTVAPGGSFRPGAPVSRQAMVAWLARR